MSIRQSISPLLVIAMATITLNHLRSAGSDPVMRVDLQTAIRIGIANSFALRAIQYRNSATDALIAERWREYLPRIGVGVNRVRTINNDQQDSLTNEVRFTIEQVLFDGGQRELGLDLARVDALLAREDFKITHNEIRLQVQQAFLRAMAAEGTILLNERSLARANLQIRQARTEERVGFSRRVDVYAVAARAREVELRLSEARNRYRQAIAELRRTLNLDHSMSIAPDGNLLRDYYLRPPSIDTDRLIAQALQQRPEIARSLANIRRLDMEKSIEERSWTPRISLNGYVARSGPEYPVREQSWGVGLTVTFPIGSTSTSTTTGLDVQRDGQTRAGNTGAQIDFFDDLGYDRRVLESRVSLAEAIDAHNRLKNCSANLLV